MDVEGESHAARGAASVATAAQACAARAMKQIDGSETGQEADQHGKQDEPPIMLDREAGKYLNMEFPLELGSLAFLVLFARPITQGVTAF